MNKLNFKEVIAIIKEGEVWEGNFFDIEKKETGVTIRHKRCEFEEYYFIDDEEEFKLKMEEVDFKTALDSCYEGKVIKSLETDYEYTMCNTNHYARENEKMLFVRYDDLYLSGSEMKGKWVIK